MIRQLASPPVASLAELAEEVIGCRRCPRLVAHRERMACTKRRAFQDWEYWGRPLPGFGDRSAQLMIIGLAPAAHGGNRTGRIFTGDRSGDWLYDALHRFGFANQPTSVHRNDGLSLTGAYVTAAARCAPPDNKPTPEELRSCQRFLQREIVLLGHLRVIITLGRVAFDAYLRARQALGQALPQPRPQFGHAAVHPLGTATLIGSYHPSQRNTQTGLLTHGMFDIVFATARRLIDDELGSEGVGL